MPLHFIGAPLGMKSNACARQTEPGCRHAITKERPLREMDAPSAGGLGDLGDFWQGRGRPFHLKRQLSLPDLLLEGHRRVGP